MQPSLKTDAYRQGGLDLRSTAEKHLPGLYLCHHGQQYDGNRRSNNYYPHANSNLLDGMNDYNRDQKDNDNKSSDEAASDAF